jgi:transcriptional regulator with XRE-family HTH domain
MSQNNANLGKKLAVLTKLKGFTQEEVAKTCAMSRISINRFFKSHTEIRASDLGALLNTLGINLDQLIDRAIERQINGSHSLVTEDPITTQLPQQIQTLPHYAKIG